MGRAVGIVGDEQAHRDMRGPERFGEFHGGIAADGMADHGDRLGVAAVIADRLIGDRRATRMGVDVGRDAGAVDAPRQFVHAPIDQADQAAEQIGAAVHGRDFFAGARRAEQRRGFAGCDHGRRDHERRNDDGDIFGSNHAVLIFNSGKRKNRRPPRRATSTSTNGRSAGLFFHSKTRAKHARRQVSRKIASRNQASPASCIIFGV